MSSAPVSPTCSEMTPRLTSTKAPLLPSDMKEGVLTAKKRVRMPSPSPTESTAVSEDGTSTSDLEEVAAKLQCLRGKRADQPLERPAPASDICDAIACAAHMIRQQHEPFNRLLSASMPAEARGMRVARWGWTPMELAAALELGVEQPRAFGSRQRGTMRGIGNGGMKVEVGQTMLLMTAGF